MSSPALPTTAIGPAKIAPFVVARVAGLPTSALDPLRLGPTREAVDAVLAHEQVMDELRERVEQALHDAVPRCPDAAVRRATIELRRDVHNGRSPRHPTRRDLGTVAAVLPVPARRVLDQWLGACDGRDATMTEGESLVEGDLRRAGRHLVQELRRPAIQLALAAVTPTFAAELLRHADATAPDTRFSRSCTAYLARTAVKTSPLSSLTTVVVHAPGERETSLGTRRMNLNRMLVLELLLAAAADEQLARALDFCVAPPVRPEWLLVNRYAVVGGYAWREERTVAQSACGPLKHAGQQLAEGSFDDYARALGGEGRTARMVACGLLRPIWPGRSSSSTRLVDLAAAFGRLHTERGEEFAAAVRTLDSAVSRASSLDLDERLDAVRTLPSFAQQAIAVAGRPAPAWLQVTSLVHEDICSTAPRAAGPPTADLDVLADAVRKTMIRTCVYQELVRDFVTSFGPEGTCRDVTAFLFGFLAHRDARRRIGDWAHQDAIRLGHPGVEELVTGPGMLPPTASVMYQVARGSAAPPSGQHLVVLNHCANGIGGSLPRFMSSAGRGHLLRSWIESLVPQALPVEVPVAAECNGLQHGGALLPVLRWPADSPSNREADGAARLGDMTLRHDVSTDTLVLQSSNGTPVVPVYLGTTPQHLVGGALRLLLTLGDPWLVGLRPGHEQRAFDPPMPIPDGVEHSARRQVGGVVLSRASWRVAADDMPLPRLGESTFVHLKRIGRWRRDRGLPDEVFLSVERRGATSSRQDHKPVWLAFDSPHALAVAARQIPGADALRFVEALPGRGEVGNAEPNGERLATEYVSLLAWPAAP